MTEEHQRVMGICYPNKCYVEVPTKEEYDITAAMAEEHEERLDNITKEVDGALSCQSVATSGNITSGGTITSTGKINANGGLAVTSLTASGTITANGIINANGGLNMAGDIVGNLKGNVTGNVTGSISGGTVAGSTGTFSGVVTAKNVNAYGCMPMSLLLLGTSNYDNPHVAGGFPNIVNTGVNGGNIHTIAIHSGNLQALKGETKEFTVIPMFRTDYCYMMIQEIRTVGGSWSISLRHSDSSGYITAYLNGEKLSTNGTTITAAKALEILSKKNTAKLVNSDTTNYRNTSIQLIFTNTGTEKQFINSFPVGFY